MQETVKIVSNKRPEGWVLLNATDFDPEQHKLWDPESLAPVEQAPKVPEVKRVSRR